MKKKIIAVSLILAMVFVIAACGNKPEGSPKEENGGTGEAVEGGELIVGITTDLDSSFDPHVSSSAAVTRGVLFNVFEGLVKADTSGNMVPAISESFTANDAMDEYTFVLRQGVKFHNGNEVKASDVVYSITRAAGLETGTPLVPDVANIKSVKATDDKTVVIGLHNPDSEFPAYLSTAAILPEGVDHATDCVGTGPFKIVSRTVQESIVLEKNADYWGEKAHLDKVTLKVIDNTETLVMSLKSGAVDMATNLIASQVSELTNMNILEGNSNAVQGLYLNNKFEPFSDVKVRQALCYGIDRQEILDIAFDGYGTLVGSSMFPAFKKYFDDSLTNLYEYNPEKAKELLKEAGYENLEFTITVPSPYQQHVDTAQVIVEQMKKIGVTAKINQVEWETWKSDTYGNRNYEATVISFDAHSLAASLMLARFQSDHAKNISNFANETYDAKFKEAMSTTDDAVQTAAFKECEKILAEEAANVYIQDVVSFVALAKGFGGFEFYPLYVTDFAKIYKVAE